MILIVAALSTALSIAPAAPVRACTAPVGATALPAVIPVELSNGHVFVKVCIGEHELDFILDTGAGNTFLDLTVARRLGFKLGSTFTVGGAGAGRVEGARVEGASVAIAGTSLTQTVPSAIDLSRLPSREGHRMDGILGYDFIARNVVAIDYARRELRVYDPRTFRYDGRGTSVPISLVQNHPNIRAEVRLADGDTVRGQFIVDVGASSILSLTKPFVDEFHLRDRVGPTIRRTGGGGIGGPTTSDYGRVVALGISGIEIAKPIVQLYGDSAGVFSERGPWIGNIGAGILRRFTLILDYAAKRIIFEPNETLGDPFEADMSGASFVMDDALSTVITASVWPGSPAFEAGLMAGDTLVAVDGAPVTPKVLDGLRGIRFRRVGERVALTVRRGGEAKVIEIVTRRLL